MTYDEIIAASFAARPAGTAIPAVVADPSPARRLRDVIEPLSMHAVWSRTVNERLAGFGLDFFGGYILGRSAALGPASPAVVAAAFTWFEPTMIAGGVTKARQAVDLDTMIAARNEATIASLGQVLQDEDPTQIDRVADALLSALAGAALAGVTAGRPLFAGLMAMPTPTSPVGKLWRACDLLREFRGDSHVVAVTTSGLHPAEANILTELWLGMELTSYSGTRAWSSNTIAAAVSGLRQRGLMDGDALTEQGRSFRAALEAMTDLQAEPLVTGLGPALGGYCDALERWSTLCIEAGTFPRDELKRAAG